MVSAEVLIAAQMLLESFPTRTIEFYCKIFPDISSKRAITVKDMAEVYGCTPQAAAKHVKTLTTRGYLRRLHYRAWQVDVHKVAHILAYTQKFNRLESREGQNEKESNPEVRHVQRQTA